MHLMHTASVRISSHFMDEDKLAEQRLLPVAVTYPSALWPMPIVVTGSVT